MDLVNILFFHKRISLWKSSSHLPFEVIGDVSTKEVTSDVDEYTFSWQEKIYSQVI